MKVVFDTFFEFNYIKIESKETVL